MTKFSKRTINETNKSWLKIGEEDSIISYKSMGTKQVPLENNNNNTPSINEQISNNKSVSSNAANKTGRNQLTSKDIAKDILNKSGIFNKISKPAPMKITRKGTQFFPGILESVNYNF